MAERYVGAIRFVLSDYTAAYLIGYGQVWVGISEGMNGQTFKHTDPNNNDFIVRRDTRGGNITCHIITALAKWKRKYQTVTQGCCISKVDEMIKGSSNTYLTTVCEYYRCEYGNYLCGDDVPDGHPLDARNSCGFWSEHYDPYWSPDDFDAAKTYSYLIWDPEGNELDDVTDQDTEYYDEHDVETISYTINSNSGEDSYKATNSGVAAPAVCNAGGGYQVMQYRLSGDSYGSEPYSVPWQYSNPFRNRNANLAHLVIISSAESGGDASPVKRAFIDKYLLFDPESLWPPPPALEFRPMPQAAQGLILGPFIYNPQGGFENLRIRWINFEVDIYELIMYEAVANVYPPSATGDVYFNQIDASTIVEVYREFLPDVDIADTIWFCDDTLRSLYLGSSYNSTSRRRKHPETAMNSDNAIRSWVRRSSSGTRGHLFLKLYYGPQGYTTQEYEDNAVETEDTNYSDWIGPKVGMFSVINLFDITINDTSFTIGRRYDEWRTRNALDAPGIVQAVDGLSPFTFRKVLIKSLP